MNNDMQVQRAAFEAWYRDFRGQVGVSFSRRRTTDVYESNNVEFAWRGWLAGSQSIPAAATLLRAAGWKVDEPKCETCEGSGSIPSNSRMRPDDYDCPACNGTGMRVMSEIIKQSRAVGGVERLDDII